jgi:hypothetical protein
MPRFTVTYGTVTPESAEHGDYAETGFILSGGWKEPLDRTKTAPEDCAMTLREALDLASPQEDCGRWWQDNEGREDYLTGAVEYRSIHPPKNITPLSYARISRILGL